MTKALSSTRMRFSLLLASVFVVPCLAPFPTDHYYHFLNPWIEPWWNKLSKQEQEVRMRRVGNMSRAVS